MKKVFEKNVNGTRDLFGKNFYQREYIIETIKNIYKLHGFSPLETPTFEHLSTLLSMYGQESSKLIYKVLNSGNFLEDIDVTNENFQTLGNKICKKGLRYDLTVPLMRFVSNNYNEIFFPFKRYQIQPVFRADKPQKGRYREFYQCDIDIVGSESLLCEIEFLSIITEVFDKLKITDFTIKINDRQLLISLAQSLGIDEKNFDTFSIIIDKLDKVEFEKIKAELLELGICEEDCLTLQDILQQQGSNKNKLSFIAEYFGKKGISDESLKNLNFIFDNSPQEVLERINVDFSLARGLAYYTGIIFEVKVNNVKIGSVAGGGRYHKFAEIYENPHLKAVGMSFGIDRLIVVLDELGLFPDDDSSSSKILIADNNSNDNRFLSFLAKQFRNYGLATEIFLEKDAPLKKQLSFANKRNIPFVVIVNEKDIVVKNMLRGFQESFRKDELSRILNFLSKNCTA